MSTQFDLSHLKPEEIEKVRKVLLNLIAGIKARQVITAHGSALLKDEEITLQSLLHPERGDVLVTIVRDHGMLHVFLSNRRDPGSPFSVMDYQTMRRFPARRPVDSHHIVKDGETALFLCTQQDRDMLARESPDIISAYSSHFDVKEISEVKTQAAPVDPISKSIQEKWDSYRRHDPGDPAVAHIEKELFGYTITYAKYKASAREETVIIRPEKEKLFVGQLIRDIYPYNIRAMFRKDNHEQHLQKLGEVHSTLRKLREQVTNRKGESLPEPYMHYLTGLQEMISNVLEKDPQLNGFV